MKMHIYCLYDTLAGAYTRPQFDVLKCEDMAQSLTRAIKSDPVKNGLLKYMRSFYLGTFDDDNCTFDLLPQPLLCLDCGTVFPPELKEVKQDA